MEQIRPVSLGFFAGNLNLAVLGTPEKLILNLLILLTGIKTGDKRNWQAIRTWVDGLDAFHG